MKLYHGITSVCSIKVRIGLAEIGLDYDSQTLDLQEGDQHEAGYIALNPDAVVPTLIDGDLVLVESSLILEYLDREYNDGWLMPPGRMAQAAARHWLLKCLAIHDAINSLTFSTALRDRTLASKTAEEIAASLARMPDPLKRLKRKDLLANGLESVHVEQALRILRRTFAEMEAALERSEWMNGPEFGISDIALVSYIDRLERLGFGDMLKAPAPRIAGWLSAMRARASYRSEVSGKIDHAAAERMRLSGGKYWPELRQRWLHSQA
ncbi:MAG: glutathione S-transferase family protein [Rhodobacteraceae bacterium]|nr:glutathione S-transferase family protein [Paracoccaceae bacterium]